MGISIFVLVFVAFAAISGGIVLYAVLAEKQRKEAVGRIASELGLQFSEQLSEEDASRFGNFNIAQRGGGRRISNVIVADSGELRMAIFDYRFTTGSGKNQSTHRQNVVLASAESLSLPQFSISPESFFHRIADFFGIKDIDFEEDREFSDRFLLKGADEQAVRELFDRDRRNAFKDLQKIVVEGHADSFIFYQPRRRWPAEQLKELMEQAFSIYAALAQ